MRALVNYMKLQQLVRNFGMQKLNSFFSVSFSTVLRIVLSLIAKRLFTLFMKGMKSCLILNQ